jgi:ABC-type multidrug transport system permease subunit
MSWKLFALLSILVALFAFFPMLGVVIAGPVAQAAGCALDGGSVHPCVIAGQDYGKTLYRMSLLGWLTIYTVPLAVLAFAGLSVIQAALLLTRRRRGASET